ncbi:S41 family peptidase [Methylocapsa sp. S129]|uniref:S41 family peptidase n=1 Tax=Methylocapsa sp. S129 TaxID=1641869 RepID=UPI00131CD341|nr:S41 family peptidase [Methylocapsa sp. S129]
MLRKVSYIALGVAIGVASAALIPRSAPLMGNGAFAAPTDTYRQLNLLGDVIEKVNNNYVEKPDEGKLIEAAINGMLTSLDPHSSYLDAKGFRDRQEQIKGEFGGIGVEIMEEDGLVKIITPIDDTPAAKAGILSGDIITEIDDQPAKALTFDQAADKMRGAPNSTVRLKVSRGATKEIKEFKIVRDIIKVRSVRSHVEDGDIGYIRINQFDEQSFDGLKNAMDKFEDAPGGKLKGYILDLRNNPGGLLDQSIEIVNAFLDRGEIVSTRGRNVEQTQRYDARPGADLSHGRPLVVLINGGSASASEIVSGALQDHKRATLIGSRSFGKGSVQTIMPLGENGALTLTTARYYTPSGRSIQAKGIEPDIQILEDVPDDLKGKDDMEGEASLKGHLRNGDDEKTTASQAYVPAEPKADNQLIAAVDLLHGVKRAAAPSPEIAKSAAPHAEAKPSAAATKPPG